MISGCANTSEESVSVRGSDTMVALGQAWAEEYMIKNPQSTIQVNGGGSGTGIASLINRIADICQSSRPMKEREKRLIKERFGNDVIEIPVAKDGIVIYVHQTNPINSISISQLKDIYTGKVSNWKELGGDDKPIIVYSRENSSGTYEFFKKAVLKGDDFATQIQTLPGTGAVANAVSHEENAIGYGGNAYSSGIKLLALRKGDLDSAITASAESISDGTYPLSRDLYFYLAKKPASLSENFIAWVLSNEGQSICISQGYFPVRTVSSSNSTQNYTQVLSEKN
ncbi:MAG: phosphate ABC transporter substrate-binding protein [Chloroherpetonaceae bacterium]|nr:phosphate ABC transporter substrate-binding protein [Chloroherpetonaceae bacterium]